MEQQEHGEGKLAAQLNNSVSRAFAILRLLLRSDRPITAADVSRSLGMNGITAHRFIKSLEMEGALIQVSKGAYRLGYGLIELGDNAMAGDALGPLVQPELSSITEDLGEASMATVFQSGMVTCIARAKAHRSLSVDVLVGDRLDAYCTAHGKVWLAHMSAAQRRRYFDSVELRALTSRTPTDRTVLEAELETIKARGFAFNQGEREDGITAVAVPVMTGNGRMIVSLSVFGPSTRMTEPALEAALARLQAAAGNLRTSL